MRYFYTNNDLIAIDGKIEIKEDNLFENTGKGSIVEQNIVNVFPECIKHHVKGMGTALTAASGYVLSKMSKTEQLKILESYYSLSEMGLEYIRVSIDSCDFSPHMYEAYQGKGKPLSFENDEKFIFPYLDEIARITEGEYKILLSPWSPPACMKTNGIRKKGGKLKEEYYPVWASYIADYLLEYKRRGYKVWGLTLQNEPNAIQTWESCIYSSYEEKKLFGFVKTALEEKGLEDVKVYYYDHNKERSLQRAEVYFSDADTSAGIAVHGYCGDHFEALSQLRQQYPSKDVIMSEYCIEFSLNPKDINPVEKYAHEYINDFAYGCSLVIDWNLILDEEGGPNHVGNYCLSPVICNTHGECIGHPNMAFYVMMHLSKAIDKESKVVFHTAYRKDFDLVAFLGENRALKMVFKGNGDIINFRVGSKVFSVETQENTICTLELKESDYE